MSQATRTASWTLSTGKVGTRYFPRSNSAFPAETLCRNRVKSGATGSLEEKIARPLSFSIYLVNMKRKENPRNEIIYSTNRFETFSTNSIPSHFRESKCNGWNESLITPFDDV